MNLSKKIKKYCAVALNLPPQVQKIIWTNHMFLEHLQHYILPPHMTSKILLPSAYLLENHPYIAIKDRDLVGWLECAYQNLKNYLEHHFNKPLSEKKYKAAVAHDFWKKVPETNVFQAI